MVCNGDDSVVALSSQLMLISHYSKFKRLVCCKWFGNLVMSRFVNRI